MRLSFAFFLSVVVMISGCFFSLQCQDVLEIFAFHVEKRWGRALFPNSLPPKFWNLLPEEVIDFASCPY